MKNIERADLELIKSFQNIGVATIHECIGKETNNVMDCSIKPIGSGMKIAGSAFTVHSFPADNIMVHVALALAKPGDVIVVNGHKMPGAMFGGQMAFQAFQSKIGGSVVDGAVRDIEEIREMGFPCFASIVSPLGSAKATPGSINIPIQCGGVLVNPGDIVVGDDDGVVVIPRKIASDILTKAKKRIEKERVDREGFLQGITSMKLQNLEKVLVEKHVLQVDRLEDTN